MPNISSSSPEVKDFRLPDPLRSLHLLGQLIRRDFSVRFVGSAFGVAWAVFQPLSLVLLYWFVFSVMIPVRPFAGTGGEYVFFLISGLLPWLGINEGVMRSTTSILDNSAIVRRLPFRSELLVVVPNATALIFEITGLGLFIVFLAFRGVPLGGLWILPFALVMQLMLQIGVGFILATFFVFFRDVVQVLGFVMSIVFYLSPILYSVEGRFEHIFAWNPLTPLLGLFRSAMLGTPLPDATSIVFLLVVTAAVLGTGLALFRRAQPSFVDLI